MDVYEDVKGAIEEYIEETGKMPKRIYLGYNEWGELQRLSNDYSCDVVLDGSNLPPLAQLSGMVIYRVMMDNHIKCTD